MKILISNDDGVHAPGIVAMSNRLAALGHTVTVSAPDRERSGAGHAITTDHTLFLRNVAFGAYDKKVKVYKSNGTPADCVMLGLKLAEPEAEIILTGINSGPNLGCDVYYSGTTSAAREGYFENRRAMAVSLCLADDDQEEHYETAVHAVETVLSNMESFFDKKPALINMNVPNLPLTEVQGLKIAFAGRRRYRDRILVSSVPGGEACYWLRGRPADHEELEGSDVMAVKKGFVALTYLKYDTTDYELNGQAYNREVEDIKLL